MKTKIPTEYYLHTSPKRFWRGEPHNDFIRPIDVPVKISDGKAKFCTCSPNSEIHYKAEVIYDEH